MTSKRINRKPRAPLHARHMSEDSEATGTLDSFGPSNAGREFLAVHISDQNILLPVTLRPTLEKLRGQQVAVTLTKKKHHIRVLKGEPVRV